MPFQLIIMDNENENNNKFIEEGDTPGAITPVDINTEMRTAYIDYSMSVIVSRALPDARDGLKPVQRRVLFGMSNLGLNYGGQTKKSARIVGEVLGKYHPHGDSSVYDAMVHLAQVWNQRYPLIFGQGNFGSMDGDQVAAMRYTEAKLEKISEAVVTDLDKDTVDMQNNFDDSEQEPSVLPTKIPILLVNGSSGIAVGMATNMAPHNLGECCDAITAYIDNPDIDTAGLMKYIKGPDFPTGGIIMGIQGIKDAYETGKGRVVVRAKTEIEVDDKGRETIVVTEIPYMVNKRDMIEKIAQLVEDKKIEGITYVNDESSREGVRAIIRIKQGYNSNVILNTLFKLSPLQSSFAINNVALVNGRPETMNLKSIIANFVDFRHEVVRRRTQFELAKAQKRANILQGLLKAIDIIDEVIATIRASKNADEARRALVVNFDFNEEQARAIVEMRLRQLTGLEREKLQAEYDELVKFIAECEAILASDEKQLEVVKKETAEIKAKYADARRTEIVPDESEFNPEDFYANDDEVITISHQGYIKRTPLSEYKAQNRGGRGMKGSATKDTDFIDHLYVANMHSTMLFFTESGRCFWLKVYNIPEGSRSSKGRAIQNVLQIPDDKIKAYLNVQSLTDDEYLDNHYIVLVTKRGLLKKTSLRAYSNVRAAGVNAVTLREGDELVDALLTNGNDELLIAARNGRCVRFDETDARAMGRTASGVRGINIDDDDEVVGAIVYDPSDAPDNHTVLVVSENGYGKRTPVDEYRKVNRGGKGVITMNITDKTGKVIAIKNVTDNEDLMIIEHSGLLIRMHIADIKVAGRNTQGVKLINIPDGDSIASVSSVEREEESEIDNGEAAETPDDATEENN